MSSSPSTSMTDAASFTEAPSASFFESVSSAFSSFFPTAHADEDEDKEEDGDKDEGEDKEEGGEDDGEEGGEDEGEDEDDEDDEPEDQMPAIYEDCENSKQCEPAKHHFLECQERVEGGNGFKDENCVEEFFHLAHCATSCTAPRLFSKLK